MRPPLAAMLYFFTTIVMCRREPKPTGRDLERLRLRFPASAVCRKKLAALLTELSLAHSTSAIKLKILNMDQLS
jgi:hypothetical protein